jgi:CheY-like chemotaxis protein
MTAIRVLHVEDEPDIREVVEISLGLDPDFETRNCSSGQEALACVATWTPDIILLDVMMPLMDGPATLARLRENTDTASIPVVFMTARAQAREIDHFRSLGAAGVIPKPFDPMTLAAEVRAFAPQTSSKLDVLRDVFMKRMKDNAAMLVNRRAALVAGGAIAASLTEINDIAHSLAGAAGIFGYSAISEHAGKLEESTAIRLHGEGSVEIVVSSIDSLLQCIEAACHEQAVSTDRELQA